MEKLNDHWSKELQQTTFDRLDLLSCVKNYKEPFHGIVSGLNRGVVTLSDIVTSNYMPIPGDKVIAEYPTIKDMIKDGWVID